MTAEILADELAIDLNKPSISVDQGLSEYLRM
jgi:hypothetical protein